MSSSSPSGQGSIRLPHPLTERLISRLRARNHSHDLSNIHVVELGTGTGRNTPALISAGISLNSLINQEISAKTIAAPNRRNFYDATLSTHALLHGTVSHIAEILDAVAMHLKPNGLLYATFGSTRDARFSKGTKLDERTFAPLEGDERGVPHTYFDEPSLRKLLEKHFTITSLEEIHVDAIAGSWAHQEMPLRGAFHWFVEATVIRSRMGLDAFA